MVVTLSVTLSFQAQRQDEIAPLQRPSLFRNEGAKSFQNDVHKVTLMNGNDVEPRWYLQRENKAPRWLTISSIVSIYDEGKPTTPLAINWRDKTS